MIGVLSLGIERDNPFTLVLDGEDEEIYISKFEELLNSYE
jgi:phosphotransferase system HPr-like phosphotransfer protein